MIPVAINLLVTGDSLLTCLSKQPFFARHLRSLLVNEWIVKFLPEAISKSSYTRPHLSSEYISIYAIQFLVLIIEKKIRKKSFHL